MDQLICKYCWIEVEHEPAHKKILGPPDDTEYYIHRSVRDAVGNPFCGRARLTEADLESITIASE